MIKYILLTSSILLAVAGFSQGKSHTNTSSLSNVNVYPNAPIKSFVVDFYEKDFKEVSIIIQDMSGETIAEYEIGDVKSGSFVEMNVPKAKKGENVVVTVKSENKTFVSEIDS